MRGVPLPRRDWSEPGRGGSFSLDNLDKIILSELVGEPDPIVEATITRIFGKA